MRRTVLALAIALGLVIGTVMPVSALGETSVTLNCTDGTSVKLLVDADTLTGLTQAVQAMIDYPAGLTCTLIQNPLGAFLGGIALASPGQNSFIVGGGRYQLSCDKPGLPGVGGDIFTRDDTTAPIVASSRPENQAPFGLSRIKAKLVSSYQPLGVTPEMYWVNIAVNVHQDDATPPNFFGTPNETIPEGQCSASGGIGHGHFTSRPKCLTLDSATTNKAFVASEVTQTSGATTGNFFPGPDPVVDGTTPSDLAFWFRDNGNPGQQTTATGKDKLDGALLGGLPPCPFLFTGFTPFPEPTVPLDNGNITLHP